MNENKKLMSGLKSKLIAAICMLLVAVIMVVSSTYAWFTLSTAPEVTGITTAVGANGALEIALLPKSGNVGDIKTGESGAAWKDKNTTWGNLIDLQNSYGLENIILYPSTIKAEQRDEAGNVTQVKADAMLQYPTYGADGRVGPLVSNVASATFDGTSFKISTDSFGVRAIGTSSGLTDRQIAYRDARAAAATAMAQAKTAASNSLTTNGGSLADIALKHETTPDANYTQAEVVKLLAIVNALYGEEGKKGAFQYIEEAAMNLILAYAASGIDIDNGQTGIQQSEDAFYLTVKSIMDESNGLKDFITKWNSNDALKSIDILNEVPSLRNTYNLLYDAEHGSMIKLEAAKTDLAALKSGNSDDLAWEQISAPMRNLVDIYKMKLNGYSVPTVKDNLGGIVSSISKGLFLSIETGGGVYADIADCCGDYQAFIQLEKVEYNGITMEKVDATMKTESSVNPSHLSNMSTLAKDAGSPASGSNANLSITEFYGYVIDLAFRTNAAESKLLLQSDPIDRIYDDNSNDATMGHGASMTFSAGAGVTKEMAINLMSNFRIVFFTPGDTHNTILATAKLDTSKYTVNSDGTITAYMYLYKSEISRDSDGNVLFTKEVTIDGTTKNIGDIKYWYLGGKYYAEEEKITEVVTPDFSDTTAEVTLVGSDAVITALPQNTATKVSVLVYLEGESIENKDVAASVAESLSGTMNLQFASSAELVPVEDGNLHNRVTVEEKTIVKGATDVILAADGAATFISDDTETLTVDNTGKVTAIKATATNKVVTVTAKNSDGKIIAKWAITVTEQTNS